jgi:uronate dehydrogenase
MRVTITGAAGNIGRTLLAGLAELGHDVRGIDRKPPDDLDSDKIIIADVATDDDALDTALTGADAVVHLAAIARETDFETALDTHVRLTHRLLERARAAGVRRVIYASSNHAVGFTPRGELLTAETRSRPDTYYGVGKVTAEALCSLFHDRYGLEIACLRIGSFRQRPDSRRALSTWLSPGDAVRLVDACLTSPGLGFAVLYGVSANTRGWWDLGPARALGYEPRDDAERWAAQIEVTPESEVDRADAEFVGGGFTRIHLDG